MEDAKARTTDPDTSHQAAEAVAPHVRLIQENVLKVFQKYGALTHHSLISLYRRHFGQTTPESTIRTRCKELVVLGRVVDSGQRLAVTGSTRKAILWRLA